MTKQPTQLMNEIDAVKAKFNTQKNIALKQYEDSIKRLQSQQEKELLSLYSNVGKREIAKVSNEPKVLNDKYAGRGVQLKLPSGSSISIKRVPRSNTQKEEINAIPLPPLPVVKPFITKTVPYPLPIPRIERENRDEINNAATRVKLATNKMISCLAKKNKQVIIEKLKTKQQQRKLKPTIQSTQSLKRKSDSLEIFQKNKFPRISIEAPATNNDEQRAD